MSRAWPDSRTSAAGGRPRRISNVWPRLTRWTGVSSVSMAIVSGLARGPVSRRHSWPSRPSQFPAHRLAFGHDGHRGQPPRDERGDDRQELQAPLGELVKAGGDRWRGVDADVSPLSSMSFRRAVSRLVAIPGRPSRRSVNRHGPWLSSSRTISSTQRSPTRSSDRATAQYWL